MLGCSIGYWQGSVKNLVDDIAALQPAMFIGVPRVFDRIHSRITGQVRTWGVSVCARARVRVRVCVCILGVIFLAQNTLPFADQGGWVCGADHFQLRLQAQAVLHEGGLWAGTGGRALVVALGGVGAFLLIRFGRGSGCAGGQGVLSGATPALTQPGALPGGASVAARMIALLPAMSTSCPLPHAGLASG